MSRKNNMKIREKKSVVLDGFQLMMMKMMMEPRAQGE